MIRIHHSFNIWQTTLLFVLSVVIVLILMWYKSHNHNTISSSSQHGGGESSNTQLLLSILHEKNCTALVDKIIATNLPITFIKQSLVQLNHPQVDSIVDKINCCVENRLLQELATTQHLSPDAIDTYRSQCTVDDTDGGVDPVDTVGASMMPLIDSTPHYIKIDNKYLKPAELYGRPTLDTDPHEWTFNYLFDDVYLISSQELSLHKPHTDMYPIMKDGNIQSTIDTQATRINEPLFAFMWRITPTNDNTYTIHEYLNNYCLAQVNNVDVQLTLDNQAGASMCGCADKNTMSKYLFEIIPT